MRINVLHNVDLWGVFRNSRVRARYRFKKSTLQNARMIEFISRRNDTGGDGGFRDDY